MTNYFARFRNRGRIETEPRRTGEAISMVISADARVSLEGNGAVFLHARSGIVFSSNRIGARIWQGLMDHEGVETIAARISRENGVGHDQVRQDARAFVAELETHGFLHRGMEG